MRVAILKSQLESAIGRSIFSFRERPTPQTISTGVPEVDSECGGLPRGAITEITGPSCSGRTTLLYSILAEATVRGEACALVDASDAFDPESAEAAGTDFQRLLWIRCAAQKKSALPVTDLLLQSGGWGVIALDLGDIAPEDARRVPLHAWHRFRLAVENKPTVFVVIGQESYAGSCSALILETNKTKVRWEGALFRGAVFQAGRRKPPGRYSGCFEAVALR